MKPAIKEWITQYNEEALIPDGFDDAFVGIAERFRQEPVLVYDRQKCISILQSQDMTEEEAVEFFEHNTLGSWVGDNTPIFITKWSDTL
jgi:hypothetical protein